MYRIINSISLLILLTLLSGTDLFSAPSRQARNVSFSQVTSTSMRVSWINGNGGNRIVVVSSDSAKVAEIDAATHLNGDPFGTANAAYDNASNTISTSYGTEAKVVYQNSGRNRAVSVTNLSPNTTYWVKVFEYNYSGGVTSYNSSTYTNNPRSKKTDLSAPTNLAVIGSSLGSFATDIIWDGITDVDGYIIDVVEYNNDSGTPHPDYEDSDIGLGESSTGTSRSYSLDYLTGGRTYAMRLKAYDGPIESAYSSPATSFTTPTDTEPATFTSAYYTDSGLSTTLGGSSSPTLTAGTYYIEAVFNEELDTNPLLYLNANGDGDYDDAADLNGVSMQAWSSTTYVYARTIPNGDDGEPLNYNATETFTIAATDYGGNSATLAPSNSLTNAFAAVDNASHTVNYVDVSSGTYGIGDKVELTVVFTDLGNDDVFDNTTATITVNGVDSDGDWTQLSGNTYTTSYTVAEGNTDIVSASSLTASGTISIITEDHLTLNRSVEYTAAASTTVNGGNEFYVDANKPVLNVVDLTPGMYKVGDVITATIVADDDALGNDTGLLLSSGSINEVLVTNFTDIGSGSYTVDYTVVEGDTDRGSAESTSITIQLNDNANNSSNILTSAISSAGQFSIDANSPVISEVILPSNTFGIGEVITATFTADEAGYSATTTSASFSFDDNTATDFTDLGGGKYSVSFTFQESDTEHDNANTVVVHAVMNDDAGNESNTYVTVPTANAAFRLDAERPVISSATFEADQANMYGIGDEVSVSFTTDGANYENFSATINNQVSTDFTNHGGGTYSMTYTVADGDIDREGAENVPFVVQLDDNAQNTSLSTTITPEAAVLFIDANKAVISALSTSSGTYKVGDAVTFTLESDDDNYTSKTFSFNGVDISGNFNNIGSNSYTTTYTISENDASAYEIATPDVSFYISDTFGNSSVEYTTTPTLVGGSAFYLDAHSPTITAFTVESGDFVVGSTITATITTNTDNDFDANGGLQFVSASFNNSNSVTNFVDNGDGIYFLDYIVTEGGTDVSGTTTLDAWVQLRDNTGNNSATFDDATSTTISIDANTPEITEIQIESGQYGIGAEVEVHIITDGVDNYSKNTITANGVATTQFSQSTNTYTTTYTVVEGNTDRTSAGAVPVAATIDDPNGNTSANFTTSSTVGNVYIDATRAVISELSTESRTYKVGDDITFTLVADDDNYTAHTFTFNNVDISASFTNITSNSYTTTYTVGEGDNNDVNIAGTDISFYISDTFGNSSNEYTTTPTLEGGAVFHIDAHSPTITGVTILTGNYKVGSYVSATIATDITTQTDDANGGLNFTSASFNNSNSITDFTDHNDGRYSLTYTVVEGDTDRNGVNLIPISVQLQDDAGNLSNVYTTAPNAQGGPVTIDGNTPVITGVEIESGQYGIGQEVEVHIYTDGVDDYEVNSINVNSVATTQFAQSTNTYTTTYTVVEGNTDSSRYINSFSITIEDPNGNTSATWTTAATAGTVAIDANKATISELSIPSNTYSVGEEIVFTLESDDDNYTSRTFSFNGVTLTDFANTGSNSYTTTYTVSENDASAYDIATPDVSFYISDTFGNSSVEYTTAPTLSGGSAFYLDAHSPTITEFTVESGDFVVGSVITATITTNTTNDFDANGGLQFVSASFNNSNSVSNFVDNGDGIYFLDYTVTEGGTYVSRTTTLDAWVQLQDNTGNLSAVFNDASQSSSISIDANTPEITEIQIESGQYGIGQEVEVHIITDGVDTYTKNTVTVNGVATTQFSQNTNTYTTTYTVVSGDADRATVGAIPLAATIDDPNGNTSSNFTTSATVGTVAIDANIATISELSIPSGTYNVGSEIVFTLESDDDNYTSRTFSFNGVTLTDFANAGSNSYTTTYTVSENDASAYAIGTPDVSFYISDTFGNSSVEYTTAPTLTGGSAFYLDAHSPTITDFTVESGDFIVGSTITATITTNTDNDFDANGGLQFVSASFNNSNSVTNFVDNGDGIYYVDYIVTEGGTDVSSTTTLDAWVQLQDNTGNLSAVFNDASQSSSISIDANTPVIHEVQIESGNYGIGGKVQVHIITDGVDTYSLYSGSVNGRTPNGFTQNSNTYTTTYTVVEDDTDRANVGSIPITFGINDPNANISDAFTTSATVGTVAIDAGSASITAIALASGTYNVGGAISATITADAAGYSSRTFFINNVDVTAQFTDIGSGSYTTTYTVSEGDGDRANVGAIPIGLEIADTFGNKSASFTAAATVQGNGDVVIVDANSPVITGVSIEPGDYKIGSYVSATITSSSDLTGLNEHVIELNEKPVTDYTDHGDGKYSVTYTVVGGDTEVFNVASMTVTASLQDNGINTSNTLTSATSTGTVTIDPITPEILGISVATGDFGIDDVVSTTITTDGNDYTFGDTKYFNGQTAVGFTQIGGSNSYTTNYTVVEGDTEHSSTATLSVSFTVFDDNGNESLTFSTVSVENGGGFTIDASKPVLSQVVFENGTFGIGSTITTTFTADQSNYDSGTFTINGVEGQNFQNFGGSNSYTVDYIVQEDPTGAASRSSATLATISAYIEDLTYVDDHSDEFTSAPVNHGAPFTSIDVQRPIVSGIVLESGNHGIGSTFSGTITTTSSEDASGGLSLSSGSINNISVTDFTDLNDGNYTFNYEVIEGHTDRATVNVIPADFVLQDAHGNSNTTTAFTPTASGGGAVAIDATRPIISSVALGTSSGEGSGTWTIGSDIPVTLTSTETGLSSTSITVNGVTVTGFVDNANNTYSSTYTVVEGNTDRGTFGTTPVYAVIEDSFGNTSTTTTSAAGTAPFAIDANRPDFTVEYFATSGFLGYLGQDFVLTVNDNRTIKVVSNEPVSETAKIQINSQSDQNDVALTGLTHIGSNATSNTFRLLRPTIVYDANTNGSVRETISIRGTDLAGNTTNDGNGIPDSEGANPTNEATDAAFLDATEPHISVEYFSDAGFTTSMGDTPRLKQGTYYMKFTVDEVVLSSATFTLTSEDGANDVSATLTETGNTTTFTYTRTIGATIVDGDAVVDPDDAEEWSLIVEDLVGNKTTAASGTMSNSGTYKVYNDTKKPTATVTTTYGGTTGVNYANTSMTVTVSYDEAMIDDGSQDPSVTFSNNPSLTFTADGWSSTSTYWASFGHKGNEETITGVSATISDASGATDFAGNTDNGDDSPTFVVDTDRPDATVTVDTDPVYDGDLEQKVYVVYDEDMDDGSTPSITFTNAANFSLDGGSWNGSTRTYTATFTHSGDETIAAESATVSDNSGATDINGNGDNGDDSPTFVVDTENPNATVTTDTDPVYDGDLEQKVFIVYDEDMNTTTTPSVTFTNADYFTLDGGSWNNSTRTYTATFTHNGTSEELTNASAIVQDGSGATDVAGNTDIGDSSPDFEIDTRNPIATVTTDTDPVYDGDLEQKVFIVYDEDMNTTTTPSVTFTNSDNFALNGGSWNGSARTYTATFTHNGNSEEITNASATVSDASGATDDSGNTDIGDSSPDFTVDTRNPISTVTVDSDPIYDGDLEQKVFVVYDEDMNTTTTPSVTFTNAANFTLDGGSWNGSARTYTATFTHSGDETIAAESATVSTTSGAKDTNGNTDIGDASPSFYVDTENPTATLHVLRDPVNIANASQTISVVYDEDMDTAIDPTISMLNFSSSFTQTGATWDNARTFSATYTYNGINEGTESTTVTGGKDPRGNLASDHNGSFTVDMKAPTAVLTYKLNGTNVTLTNSDKTIEVLAVFDEAMDASTNVQLEGTNSGTFSATNMTRVNSTTYTYNWTPAGDTPDGYLWANFTAGSDLYGNVPNASGSNSSSTLVQVDNTAPTITGWDFTSSDNESATIGFSEGVYSSTTSNGFGTGAFSAFFDLQTANTNVGTAFIVGLGDNSPVAGSTTFSLALTINPDESADGTEVYTMDVKDNDALYDLAGNRAITGSPVSATMNTLASIQDIAFTTADGYYNEAKVIDVEIEYDRAVYKLAGNPSLSYNSGGSATYLSGTGSKTITMRYTIADGENSADLDYSSSITALTTGIVDESGFRTDTDLPAVGTLAGKSAIVIDTEEPTLVVGAASAAIANNSASITYEVTYTGANSNTLTTSDVTVNNSNGAGASVNVENTAATSSTITLYDFTGDGSVWFDLSENHATDLATNGNIAFTNSATVTVDNTPPTVTLLSPSVSVINSSNTVTYEVTYAGSANSVTTTTADINLTAPAGSSSRVENTGTSSSTVSFYNMTGDGSASFTLDAGIAIDLAGNLSILSSPSEEFEVDNTPPTMTITSGAADPTNSDPFSATFTSNESTVNFVVGDISVENGTADNFTAVSGTVYTANINPTGDGNVDVYVMASAYTDAATNGNTTSNTFTTEYDGTPPTMTITSGVTDPTNSNPFSATFTSNESTSNFVLGDISVENGTADNFTAVSGTVYTANINPTGDGNVDVYVMASAYTDAATNGNTTSNTFTTEYDGTPPTMTITSGAADPTNSDPFSATFTSNESTVNFVVGDISVENGTADNFTAVSGTVYTANINPTGDGNVDVYVMASAYTDAATNGNTTSNTFTTEYDGTPPTMTITSGAADPTNSDPFSATFTSNESTVNFVVGDISVENGTADNFTAVSGTVYTANINPTGDGNVDVYVMASAYTDAATNGNTTSNTFTTEYDGTPPTMTITSGAADPTNSDPFSATFTSNESTVNFVVGDISVENGTADNFTAVSGTVYTANINPTGDGNVDVYVMASAYTDAATNGNTTSNTFTTEYDGTPPTMTITSSAADPTNSDPFSATFTSNESTVNFVVGDISVENGTADNFTAVSGTVYTANINPTGDGNVDVYVMASAYTDAATNGNTTSNTFTTEYDGTPPTMTITSGAADPTNSDPFSATFTSNESTVNFVVGDISVENGTADNFTAVSGTVYTANINPTGDGNVDVYVMASAYTDAATNGNTTSNTFTTEYDGTPPTMTITSGAADPTNSDPFSATFTSNESTVNFVVGDISVENGTADNFTAVSGTVYTANINPTGDGNVDVYVMASAYTDAATNGNTTSNTFTTEYDGTPPTMTITSGAADPTNSDPFSATFTSNESTVNFVVGDISVENGTADNFTAVSGTVYTANINPTGDGNVDVYVMASAYTDAATNGNTTSNTFTTEYDGTPPTMTITSGAADPTNSDPFSATFTSNESTVNFVVGDISVENGTADNFTAVSGTVYTANINPTGDGNVDVYVMASAYTDAATNGNTTSNTFTTEYDGTPPTMTITSGAADPTNSDPFSATFTSNESTVNFVVGDISVANGTADNFTAVSGTVYTANINPTGDGNVDVYVMASAYTDAATNGNTTSNTFTTEYDGTAPTATSVSISSNNADNTRAKVGDIVTVSFTSDETITNVTGTIDGNATGTTNTGGNNWTSTYTMQSGDNEGVITFELDFDDIAGNSAVQITAITVGSNVTFDETSPSGTITVSTDPINLANTSQTVTVTYDEAMDTNTNPLLTYSGAATATPGNTAWINNTTYAHTFTYSGNTEENSVSFTFNGQHATDITGNTESNGVIDNEFDVDLKAPSASFTPDDLGVKITNGGSSTLTFSEAVIGFTDADFTVTNGSASISNVISGSEYEIELTAATEGDVYVIVGAGKVTDNKGNPNTASNTFKYQLDDGVPNLTSVAIYSNNTNSTLAKASDVVSLTFTGSEELQNVQVDLFNGTAVTAHSSDEINWTATYTLAGTEPETSVSFTIDFEDKASNAGVSRTTTTNASSVLLDFTAPTLTFSISSTSFTQANNSRTVTMTSNENLDNASYVSVFTTPNGNLTKGTQNIPNATTIYTVFNHSGASEDVSGNIAFDFGSGVVQDLAGNKATTGTNSSQAVNIYAKKPEVAITARDATSSAAIVYYDILFDEDVTGVSAANIDIAGVAGSLTETVTQHTSSSYTVSVSGMTGSGAMTASITANKVTDSHGNLNNASTGSNSTAYTFVQAYNLFTLESSIATSSSITAASTNNTAFGFKVQEDNTSDDLNSSTINQIIVDRKTGNTLDLTGYILAARLKDAGGSTIQTATIGASSLSFTGFTKEIADNAAATFSIEYDMKSTLPSGADNERLEFTLDNNGIGYVAGSTPSENFTFNSSSADYDNKILVTASKLAWDNSPANGTVNSAYSGTVSAYDANNNKDEDWTGSVTFTSNGSISNGSTGTAVAGSVEFSSMSFSTYKGSATLTTINGSSLTNATSSTFDVQATEPSALSAVTHTGTGSSKELSWTAPDAETKVLIVMRKIQNDNYALHSDVESTMDKTSFDYALNFNTASSYKHKDMLAATEARVVYMGVGNGSGLNKSISILGLQSKGVNHYSYAVYTWKGDGTDAGTINFNTNEYNTRFVQKVTIPYKDDMQDIMAVSDVYPNPVKDKLNIAVMMNEDVPVTMELFDATGQKITTIFDNELFGLGTTEHSISLKDLQIASGSYILRISTSKGTVIRNVVVAK